MRHLAVSETFSEEGFSIERCKWVASLLKKKKTTTRHSEMPGQTEWD